MGLPSPNPSSPPSNATSPTTHVSPPPTYILPPPPTTHPIQIPHPSTLHSHLHHPPPPPPHPPPTHPAIQYHLNSTSFYQRHHIPSPLPILLLHLPFPPLPLLPSSSSAATYLDSIFIPPSSTPSFTLSLTSPPSSINDADLMQPMLSIPQTYALNNMNFEESTIDTNDLENILQHVISTDYSEFVV